MGVVEVQEVFLAKRKYYMYITFKRIPNIEYSNVILPDLNQYFCKIDENFRSKFREESSTVQFVADFSNQRSRKAFAFTFDHFTSKQ